jgi:hypothetical protein
MKHFLVNVTSYLTKTNLLSSMIPLISYSFTNLGKKLVLIFSRDFNLIIEFLALTITFLILILFWFEIDIFTNLIIQLINNKLH